VLRLNWLKQPIKTRAQNVFVDIIKKLAYVENTWLSPALFSQNHHIGKPLKYPKTMTADIKGTLERIDTAYRMFEHNGRNLTKDEVRAILKYGQTKGYTNTGQISDAEVDEVLKSCFYRKMDNDLKFCF
jgi:hypothetical protein